MDKRGGGGRRGVPKFSVENFLSHSAENFRRESFTVALFSGSEKVYGQEGGGGEEYQNFPSKIFCLTVPKISVGECFIVALISGTEKVWRRGVSRFSVEFFLSHSADENFRRRIFYCCINFGYRKSSEKRGGGEYQDFPSKIFCLTVPKISVGESFIVALISGTEKVRRRERGGGVSRFSVENILSHSAENFRRGIFHCCINFGYRKSLEKSRGEGGGGSTKIFLRKFLVSSQCRKFP